MVAISTKLCGSARLSCQLIYPAGLKRSQNSGTSRKIKPQHGNLVRLSLHQGHLGPRLSPRLRPRLNPLLSPPFWVGPVLASIPLDLGFQTS